MKIIRVHEKTIHIENPIKISDLEYLIDPDAEYV